MTNINDVLVERGKVHGDFTQMAAIDQTLKHIISEAPRFDALSCAQRLALEMILHKITRIVHGNPNHMDHWVDICGYSQLIVNELGVIQPKQPGPVDINSDHYGRRIDGMRKNPNDTEPDEYPLVPNR